MNLLREDCEAGILMRMPSEIYRPVTTRDVATAAGVNQSTVSRALRNDPKIRPEVRKRILEVAEKLDYRPNPFVSALGAQVRSYRRSPQGAVLALLDSNPPDKPDHIGYRSGAEKRARQLGFDPQVFRLHELNFSLKRLNQVLYTRSISALLVLPVEPGFDLSELDFGSLAAATVDTSLHSPLLHRAESDYFQGIQLALAVLESRGYRRITYCTTRSEVQMLDEKWLGGFTGWEAMKPFNERMEPFIGEGWGEPAPFKAWVKKNKPDAIISNLNGYFKWCHEMGFGPDRIANITLGAGPDLPGISGISQNQEDVGTAAVDVIIAQIHRNDFGLPKLAKKILVQSTWVEGKTVRLEAPTKKVRTRK